MKASQNPLRKIDVIPTGLPFLDRLTGIGGIPSRRITEVSGYYSMGKTTLALMVVANAQKMGLPCLWADVEYTWDEKYAEKLGVDIEKLDFIQEELGEDTLDLIEEWARENENGLIVIDSIGGLLARQEAEKSTSGSTIGAQAKMVAIFIRKIVPVLAKRNHALYVCNQQRIDIMNSNRIVTAGGKKLEYHKSLWIRLAAAGEKVTQGEITVGRIIKASIGKNKLASTETQECRLTLIFGAGFSPEADKANDMIESGEIEKKGNTYYHGEVKIGVGMAKVREYVKSL